MYTTVTKAYSQPTSDSHIDNPFDVTSLLEEFSDMTPDDLPDELLPIRDIQHTIGLVPSLQLSNCPHYWMNPTEQVKLNKQIEALLAKGLFVIALLCVRSRSYLLQKMMDLGICVSIAALLTKLLLNIGFLFCASRTVDELAGSLWLSKIYLRSGYHLIRVRPRDEWKMTFKT
ncbi:uncharacterized protein LOC111398158 [Olea europaea var. sylvestris]|uniref:uncharacterized protein LOC111398158 n=1 Tax=Olea europaea var. sylvestris TaxID=158386 RepID=UPI000C1D0ECF|nr:uncharacterized protein LOC111398158 [Olea europaea var. sylvestris]